MTNLSQTLASMVGKLSLANGLEETTKIVAEAARELSGADGATLVLREQDKCYYADEDAISPLWKGKRFPLDACVSGWCMLTGEAACIPDIYQDPRIPQDAYKPTFVKSLCMVPIRAKSPIGAIGIYWAKKHDPSESEVKMLRILADSTAVALENLELRQAISLHSSENAGLKDKASKLELTMFSMAHDLRSPLAVMVGLGELLREQLSENANSPHLKHLDYIVMTGLQAGEQINRMLSLHRAAKGKINKSKVDLTELANKIVSSFQAVSSKPIECKIQPDMVAFGDPCLLHIVLENLLSNAVKFSSKREKIEIEVGIAEEESDRFTIFVKDNGVGFDSKDSEKLFVPLSRLDKASEFDGTGLGLSSVVRIVELHGGKVRAEGKDMEGSTFYFSLPKSVA